MIRARRRAEGGVGAWPGYVDALTALLLIVTFVLLVFVLAQGFLSVMLSTRDQALERLNRQVAEMADMLALERARGEELRGLLARAETRLRDAEAARDALGAELPGLRAGLEREGAARDAALAEAGRLRGALADAEAAARAGGDRAGGLEAQLSDALRRAEAATGDAAEQLRRLGAAQRDASAAREARGAAEQRAAAESGAAATARLELAALQRRVAEADAALAAAERRLEAMRAEMAALDRTARADRATLEARLSDLARLREDTRALEALRDQLRAELGQRAQGEAEQTRISQAAQAQVALLNRQIDELRAQLSRLADALTTTEARERGGAAETADLRARLNAALAARVEELQSYRSDFFGRLRQVLGDRPEIRILGDRFVLQSEILFPPARAELSPAGERQIRQLARVLLDIAGRIPPDVAWVLRVDGHADSTPIRSPRFASNWELSAARSIAVSQLLIAEGLPPARVAAAAFGEYQPIEQGDTPQARARNRRIELRLTDR